MNGSSEIVGRIFAEFIDNVRTGESETRLFDETPKPKKKSSPKHPRAKRRRNGNPAKKQSRGKRKRR